MWSGVGIHSTKGPPFHPYLSILWYPQMMSWVVFNSWPSVHGNCMHRRTGIEINSIRHLRLFLRNCRAHRVCIGQILWTSVSDSSEVSQHGLHHHVRSSALPSKVRKRQLRFSSVAQQRGIWRTFISTRLGTIPKISPQNSLISEPPTSPCPQIHGNSLTPYYVVRGRHKWKLSHGDLSMGNRDRF